MRILGISTHHRDAAAALLVDGVPVAACREASYAGPGEHGFPRRAVHGCLELGGLAAADLDAVVVGEKPLRRFERELVAQLSAFPRSARSFSRAMLRWLGDRLWIKNRVLAELGVAPDKVRFVEQHLALAELALAASPLPAAAVLIADDAAEWAATSLGAGDEGGVRILRQVDLPHSLGLFAAAMTQFVGLQPGRDEHLLEALAADGTPVHAERLGSLFAGDRLDQAPFRFAFDRERLYGDGLETLLGAPRFSGDPLLRASDESGGDERRHADIAASVQQVLEARVLHHARELHELAGGDALCFAGALAGNRRLVTRLLADGPFRRLAVPAPASRAGAALGAALRVHRALGGASPRPLPAGCGTAVGGRAPDPVEVVNRLARGARVALVRGPLEFVDRGHTRRCGLAAPGGRRALLDDLRLDPFAPCQVWIPEERLDEYVDLPDGGAALCAAGRLQLPVRDALRQACPDGVDAAGTAWVRSVAAADDPELHVLLAAAGDVLGAPVLLAVDLALRGGEVARGAFDADRVYRRSTFDALFAGDGQVGRRRAT